jgi:26S proteasome regulatory subunit T2
MTVPCSHAIVSTSTGPEYYVSVLSIVDKGQLEPGCTVLLHNKVLSVVGLLSDETDPMVSVMKVRSASVSPMRLFFASVGSLLPQWQ